MSRLNISRNEVSRMTQPEIEAFLSICRNKSISKAAEELYISQSSLSLRLKTLEEALGTPLLLRGKGKREDELEQIDEEIHYATPQTRSATSVMIM